MSGSSSGCISRPWELRASERASENCREASPDFAAFNLSVKRDDLFVEGVTEGEALHEHAFRLTKRWMRPAACSSEAGSRHG